MMRKKGIAGRCLIDSKIHFGWNVYPLPMDNLQKLTYTENTPKEKSVFYKGSLIIDEAKDTFLKLQNFTKGFVTINGFNIGRYWEIGPQQTLYVPASLLKKGENEIVVFESDGIKGEAEVEFCDTPVLG
ncbi:MAG: beta-galactosidase, partial [Clostridia bacterium]|nr:beta-galactosidase [Clostridia bacterium]